MAKQISLDDYLNNDVVLKSFGLDFNTDEEIDALLKKAEEKLEENFGLGKITEEEYDKSLETLDFIKADPSKVGTLHPVHIVDKAGRHTIVWKKDEYIKKDGHKKIGVGHEVKLRGGKKGVVKKIIGYRDHGKSRGYLAVIEHDDGKQSRKYVHNLELTGKIHHNTVPLKSVGRPKKNRQNGEFKKMKKDS